MAPIDNPPPAKRKNPSWKNDLPPGKSITKKNSLDPLKNQAEFKRFWQDYGYDISKRKYEQKQAQSSNPGTSTTRSEATIDDTEATASPMITSTPPKETDWKRPKKTIRQKKKTTDTNIIEDNNSYSELSEEEDDTDNEFPKLQDPNNKQKHKKKVTLTSKETHINKKINKPPPIHIYDQKIKNITDILIKNNIDKDSFWAKQRYETHVLISPMNLECYDYKKNSNQ